MSSVSIAKQSLQGEGNYQQYKRSQQPKLSQKEYEGKLYQLNIELVKVQSWVKDKGLKLLSCFKAEILPTKTERVMGCCNKEQVMALLRTVASYENMIQCSGIQLIKFWFSMSKGEQVKRFYKRQADPIKHWKLSHVDLASQSLWGKYTRAIEDMFYYISTLGSPWVVVK